MSECKRCKSERFVKNGKVRGKQRYKCSFCSLNFVEGDERSQELNGVRKALAVILYRLSNYSYEELGTLFGVSAAMAHRWGEEYEAKAPVSREADIQTGLKYDDLLKFMADNKEYLGGNKRWFSAKGEVCPGFSAVIFVRRAESDVGHKGY